MFARLEELGPARLGMTDRWGGSSSDRYAELNLGGHVGDEAATVARNRGAVAAALSVEADRLLFSNQVHGIGVAVVDGPWESTGAVPEVDAMVTTVPGLVVGALVADCTPVVLANADPPVVAVAHAGRRGMASGVVKATVEAMTALGADPGTVLALVGPGICGHCYEVPAALQDEVAALEPHSRSTTRQGTPGIDVQAGVVAQLRAAGVQSLLVDPTCTYESPDLYSHRRDGVTGRFAGLAWIADGVQARGRPVAGGTASSG